MKLSLMSFPMTLLSKHQVEKQYNTAGSDECQNGAFIESIPPPCTESSAPGMPVAWGEEVTKPDFLEGCSHSLRLTIYDLHLSRAASMLSDRKQSFL